MTINEALSILELKPHFTTVELGKAYRHALMVWHPDRFSGNEELIKKAQERTRGIIEAFELLSPLAVSDGAAGTTSQAGNASAAREAGLKSKPRPASVVPKPQVKSLTSDKKSGSGSSDKATWIISGVSVVGAVALVAVLSHHSPKLEDAPPNVLPSATADSLGGVTPSQTLAEDDAKPNAEAVKSYRVRAEQGDARAQFQLGRAYFFGEGVAKNSTEAVKWWSKAANGGNADAQWILGTLYSTHDKEAELSKKDTGIAKDDAEAIKWLRKSAEQGNANGQIYLAGLFERGEGTPKDEDEAANWYRKAAVQNVSEAQYALGLMYANGKIGLRSAVRRKNTATQYDFNTATNYVEAHVWLNLAGANGHENARTKIADIENVMTRGEIDQAAVRANELFEKFKEKMKK